MVIFQIRTLIYIMNLLIKKLGAVLIISALFFSCEDPSEVGLNLNPDLQNLKIQFVDIPLEVVNVRFDSINTTNQGRLLVGNVNDPEFGRISATAFTEMRPSFSNPKIPNNAEFMSLKLNLLVNYEYGINPNSNQKFYVHQLSDVIESDSTIYYKENSIDFSADVIGQFNISFDPNNNDTIKANISDIVGEDFFNKAKDTIVFKSASSFSEYFKGLAFVSDVNNSAIIGINSESAETKMTLTYKTPTDTTELEFLFNVSASGVALITKHFNQISIDDAGMPVEGINEFYKEFSPINNKIYLQAGAGLFPKIKLDALRDFVSENNIVVNRADLIIDVVSDFQDFLTPPNTLSYFKTNSTNGFIRDSGVLKAVRQFNANANLTVSYLADATVPFVGNISLFTQNLVSENGAVNADEDVLLIPDNRYISVNRMSFNKDKVRIRLYYTTFDQ